MLIKRKEHGNKVDVVYNSSHILASNYDKITKELTVIFSRGASYTYEGVRASDYTRFELAESQGKVLNSKIKSNYTFRQNANVDITQILEDINTVKSKEQTDKEQALVTMMKQFVEANEGVETINFEDLTKIQSKMEELTVTTNE